MNDKKIISYSLFDGKMDYSHREWDEFKQGSDRYWYNIPSVVLANKVLYPDYIMRIYLAEELKDHPLSCLLESLKKTYSLEVVTVSDEYKNHDAALWRVKPLWEEIDILLSRDIDSLPNEEEFMHSKFFEQSSTLVHSIRSHENHFQYPCRMLIGLSGFKPTKVPSHVKQENFEEFKAIFSPKGDRWDNDQISVIKAFTDYDTIFTMFNFLDSKINDQTNKPDFSCYEIEEEDVVNVKLEEKQKEVLDLVKKYQFSEWAGQPCDARGQFLKDLITLTKDTNMIKMIKESDCESFYKI